MKSAHLKGGKGHRGHPNKMDGKKSENDCFMYQMAVVVGCPCEVTIRDGRKYDGVFSAYAVDRHELLVEAAHLITDESAEDTPITESYDVLVVPTDKMLSVRFKSVDTSYATRDFATDTAITAARNASLRDKELTPWDGPDGSDEDLSLEADLTTTEANGWEAKDMFKKNEEKYGVKSSYSQDLSGYTTKIDKSDLDSLKKHEQQATQIAQEIEKNVVSWERNELENGDDEEEAFSAVVRPRNSGGHSNMNHNNNNNSSSNNAGGSDKYIPPSRRMGGGPPQGPPQMPQPQQNMPMNNNGAAPINNNSQMNPRNKIYGQNPNPRGGYGGPPNNAYHDRRNNYDNRRGPPPNQYPPPNSHNEGRRMDDGGRQQRVPNKPAERRGGGRDDSAKLKEFSNNFRLQTSDQNQPRRMPMNQPHPNANSQSISVNSNVIPSGADIGGPNPTRNSSPPSALSNKSLKEDSVPPVTPGQQTNDISEKGNSNSSAANSSTPNFVNTSLSNVSINSPSVNDSTPISGSNSAETPNSGDSKCSDSKKFTFNPNAKEFNPCGKSFTSRSPSTPPRPPSTPAQVSTPQMPQQIHSFMPIPMQMLYAQPYAQTAALTPSSSSSASSAGATPRHGGHRKGMLGGPPRSEMTPPIQMATGPPLLAPASLQTGGAPPQYYVPQGPYSQVMRVAPMPMFQTEGGGSTQMHQQVHYMQHNGAPPNSGHPNSNTPSNTPNAQSQTPVVSANGQGYNQGGGNPVGGPHVGFPYGVVPVMNVGYPHGHPHMITLPYVPSHQGNPPVIPQSQ